VPILVVQGKTTRVSPSPRPSRSSRDPQGRSPRLVRPRKDEGHGFAKKVNQDYLMAAEVLFSAALAGED